MLGWRYCTSTWTRLVAYWRATRGLGWTGPTPFLPGTMHPTLVSKLFTSKRTRLVELEVYASLASKLISLINRFGRLTWRFTTAPSQTSSVTSKKQTNSLIATAWYCGWVFWMNKIDERTSESLGWRGNAQSSFGSKNFYGKFSRKLFFLKLVFDKKLNGSSSR